MRFVRSNTEGEVSDDKPPSIQTKNEVLTLSSEISSEKPTKVPESDWCDWRWQMRNRIRNITQLKQTFPGLTDGANIIQAAKKFPLAITPYYASLIHNLHNSDPIYQMCVPQVQELFDPPCLKDDPLEEDEDMPVPGLVHRYPDRALLITTTTCATYCRHCTRKRVAGQRESTISERRLHQVREYLISHPEIRDVIVSGGDPLTMATAALEHVLATVRSITTVEIIRIGTRVPVVLPMRITEELVTMLRKYHPIFINTHFNHPNELTDYSKAACMKLVDAGIPIGNQSVLLHGVNDDPKILEVLFRALVRIRVRPYYLYQCDLVRGVEHFRTPISRGIEVMEYLRGRLSGLAIPSFVVDAPHGGGKIPVMPNYIVSMSPTNTVLRNFEGMLVSYPEPSDLLLSGKNPPKSEPAPGVWELVCGQYTKIEPAHSIRGDRRKKEVFRQKSKNSHCNSSQTSFAFGEP